MFQQRAVSRPRTFVFGLLLLLWQVDRAFQNYQVLPRSHGLSNSGATLLNSRGRLDLFKGFLRPLERL